METKLVDFDADQLQHAFDEIMAGILRLESFPAVYYYIRYGTVYNKDNEDDQKAVKRYLNLCLWRTQILNAIGTVQMRQLPEMN